MDNEISKNCLFCLIAQGRADAQFVERGELAVAFHDIRPKARVHLLIVPKRHVESPGALTPEELSEIFKLTVKLAEELKISQSGYRLLFNVGRHAGQEIEHVHLHLIGGQPSVAMY